MDAQKAPHYQFLFDWSYDYHDCSGRQYDILYDFLYQIVVAVADPGQRKICAQ